MKDFIQKLQQYPKAWEKFTKHINIEGLSIELNIMNDGRLNVEGFREGHSKGYHIFEELGETRFAAYEGFLNSFIESEGYYMMLSTNIFGDNKSPYSCNVKKLNRLQWEVRGFGETPAEAKQSAIIEAFKLIEQGL